MEEDGSGLTQGGAANGLMKRGVPCAKGNGTADVDDGDSLRFAICGSKSHRPGQAPLDSDSLLCPPLPLLPGFRTLGNFLDIIISAPPLRPGTTVNSSMKARMRKMPRPEVLKRFSSARGSGTLPRLKPLPSSRT